jgi:hypothetical protein
MTIIAGLIEGGIVYMGADSGGSDGCFICPRKDPKIFALPNFLFGVAGSPRVAQLLKYK